MSRMSKVLLTWLALLAVIAAVRFLAPVTLMPEVELEDGMGHAFEPPPPGLLGTVTGLGFLLLGAWLTGIIFHAAHLPRICGYLVFGVLVGPNLVDVLPLDLPALVPGEQLGYLNLINAIAISLIALTAGGEIRLEFLRERLSQVLAITAGLLVFGFVLVAGSLALLYPMVPLLEDQGTAARLILILLIATLALAGSPAVVMAMLGETSARGPMARSALAVVVMLDLVLIVLFTVIVSMALNVLPVDAAVSHPAERDAAPGTLIAYLAQHLIGSILIGILLGMLLAPLIPRIGQRMGIFVIGLSLGIAILSQTWGLEALLVALAAGFVLANRWPGESRPLFTAMEDLAIPVYCVFFAVAGAHLDVQAVIELWPIALFIVVVRAVAIWSGTRVGAAVSGLEKPAATWLWTAFIPQAGVSVALIASLQQTFAGYDWIVPLASLLLALVAIHELVGPILMRLGLVRSGEAHADEETPDERT